MFEMPNRHFQISALNVKISVSFHLLLLSNIVYAILYFTSIVEEVILTRNVLFQSPF